MLGVGGLGLRGAGLKGGSKYSRDILDDCGSSLRLTPLTKKETKLYVLCYGYEAEKEPKS